MDRLEKARTLTGLPAPFSQLDLGERKAVADAIENEATPYASEWFGRTCRPGSTVVIEFARGGPEGSELPLFAPFGYGYALSQLSEEILRRAAILYVLVTPDESRRRNKDRAEPGAHGSTLHHGVPDKVLRAAYGIDDMAWLLDHSEQPGTVTIRAHGSTFLLPVACFDNRRRRSLFEGEIATGPPGEVTEDHMALRQAFAGLVRAPA